MAGLQNDLQFSHDQSTLQSSLYRRSSFLELDDIISLPCHPRFGVYDYTNETGPTELGSHSMSHTPTTDSSHTHSPDASSPISPTRPSTRSRSSNPNHIPRPRNAFMIFRSEFSAGQKIGRTVEHDHRHISRIIGHIWNEMPESEKAVWRRKAEKEKLEHYERYPGYRFCPSTRSKPPSRRNVKRNGAEELLRCRQVADLLLSGKQGEELTHAVKNISLDPSLAKAPETPLLLPVSKKKTQSSSGSFDRSEWRVPLSTPTASPPPREDSAFLSPLLPPAVPESCHKCQPDLFILTDNIRDEMDSHDLLPFTFFSPSGTYDAENMQGTTLKTGTLPPSYAAGSMAPTVLTVGSPHSSIDHHFYLQSMSYSQHDDSYPSLQWTL